jgi:hypothetical protein
MPRLSFLLEDAARWPAQKKDANLRPIQAMRARLKQQCSGYFRTADELAVEVLTALRVLETTARAERLAAMQEMVRTQELGPSYLMNLRDQLCTLGDAPFIELQLGPTPWWNTRLHLVAALAQERGGAHGIVFVNALGRFVKAAAPAEVCRRLGQRWPGLQAAYAAFRLEAPTLQDVEAALWRYPMHVAAALGQPTEEAGSHVLTIEDIEDTLGLAAQAETVDVADKNQRYLQREILGRRSPWVALLRDERLQGLVDRRRLAERVAQAALAEG